MTQDRVTRDPALAGRPEDSVPAGSFGRGRRPVRLVGCEAGKNLMLLGFLVLVYLWFATQSSLFATFSNAENILSASSVLGIVALGQMMTIVSGGFDLSVGGTVPLGSVLYAELLNSGLNAGEALLLVVLCGVAVGVINGVIISRFNINPLATTLATMSAAGGLALALAGGVSIPFKRPVGVLSDQSAFGISNSVWIFLAACVVIFVVLRHTVFGRSLYAIGGNKEAALLAGLRIYLVETSVYVVSGALAALAGAILASQVLTGSGTEGADIALSSVAAAIVGGVSLKGGQGGVSGTLLGILILGTLANGMQVLSIQAFYQTIATGVILLAAVALSQLHWQAIWKLVRK